MKARLSIPFAAAPPVPPAARAAPPRLALPARRDLWVFAYGSLMWDPGFPYREARRATLHGYHRAFCIWSHHYRGTPRRPGLVLGLSPGGACVGRAFRVARADREAVIDYLYRREMLAGEYRPHLGWVRIGGRRLRALAFVADPGNPFYAARLPEKRVAAILREGRGVRGSGRDYLANTVRHLDELGIPDGPLHRLLRRVEARAR
jgi:cation transport protein ChaC